MTEDQPFDRKFSHSSMYCYRRCRARYYWSYIKNLTTPAGIGQVRGTVGHEALGTWYKNLHIESEERDRIAMKAAEDKLSELEIASGESYGAEWELLSIILPRYFEWARANDSFTEVIDIEHKFEIELNGMTLQGYIDGIVKIKDSIWLLEHKFNKRVSVSHIDLDPQMSIYLLAAYKQGIEARGVLFNVVRVAEGGIAATQPVERRRVFRNQEGLAFIEEELSAQMQEMKNFHLHGGHIYRNETSDCSWDCSFYDACLLINDCGDPSSVLNRFQVKTFE